jgi:putative ABC transport system permease protein
MLSNHLKIILRQLTRTKTFSIVNLTGLILGITVCLFVAQFVWFERSFENFNVNADRTYRVNLYNTSNGIFDNISAGTVSGLAYSMKQTLPGIEAIGRLSSKTKGVVSNKEHLVEDLESEIVFADPSIIDILGIDLIKGDRLKVLTSPQSIVISRSIALKYFDDTNVVGKSLEMGFNGGSIEVKLFQIEGVFNDIPSNAHQHFDFILPNENEQAWNENWAWSNVSTYVRLQQGISPQNLSGGLAQIVKQHHQDDTGDKYLLEAITEIRLHALDGSGRATMVNFFIILGGVILLLAWFNYVSLSTARFLERMKEVGVRKLVGASRMQLILQLLSESLFFNFISFSCALLLFLITWPLLANYLQIPTSQTFLHDPFSFVVIPFSIVIGAISSGLYPSLFLSSFKPLQSVKGKLNEFTDRSILRKALVIVQLSISVILITSIFAIERQLNFMRSQNIGIAIDQTLIIEEPLLHDATTIQKFEPFKNELRRLPSVTGVTYASTFAGSEIDWHRTDITLGEENADYRYDSRIIGIGTDFLDVFDLKLVSGRNFDPSNKGDNRTMLINEEAYRMFGFKTLEEALGKLIFLGSRKFEIIGVVKNYHVRSFQYQIQPVLFIQGYPRNPSYVIKIRKENIAETISSIESEWKKAYHGNVFRYHFLDEQFERQYSSEKQIATIISGLTFLAIIISFLGLFGLSLYTVNRRTKEIGIRKVLGASVVNVVILLSRDFVKLVVIGGIIGVPFVYQGSKIWLERYAYQMPIDISLFVLPVCIVTLLTLITISFQTMTAARSNPVDSIKDE